ncbi:MAG TPA: hypothetical protein PLL89_04090 [bacterium]|nr:hypothetical protein [bacterium]
MNTSYYFSKIINPKTMNLVGISQSIPKYLKGKIRVYKPLCPPWSLVSASKNGEITEFQYEAEYTSTILNNLDPEKVYQELKHDAVLLCWEKPEKFCHRHIVARWLSQHLKISVTEL